MTDILKCTIKKSADVTKKLVLYASYMIVVTTTVAGTIFGVSIIWSVIAQPIYQLVQMLFGIPWYYYVGIVAITVIPVYSLLWCMACELTDEDWQSEEAKDIADAFTFAFAVAVAFAAAAAAAFAVAFTFAVAFAFAFAVAVAFTFAFTFAAVFAADSKLGLFIGAYLHYRKRTKGGEHQ